jgi:hypothetical protein
MALRAHQQGPGHTSSHKAKRTNNDSLKTEEEWTAVAPRKGSRINIDRRPASPARTLFPSHSPVNPFTPLAMPEVILCTLEDFPTLGEPSTPPRAYAISNRSRLEGPSLSSLSLTQQATPSMMESLGIGTPKTLLFTNLDKRVTPGHATPNTQQFGNSSETVEELEGAGTLDLNVAPDQLLLPGGEPQLGSPSITKPPPTPYNNLPLSLYASPSCIPCTAELHFRLDGALSRNSQDTILLGSPRRGEQPIICPQVTQEFSCPHVSGCPPSMDQADATRSNPTPTTD